MLYIFLIYSHYYYYVHYRRCFHFFSFGFIFMNAFVGIFSTILRMITALAVGLLLFIRLDKVLLMKGFEYFDRGKSRFKYKPTQYVKTVMSQLIIISLSICSNNIIKLFLSLSLSLSLSLCISLSLYRP